MSNRKTSSTVGFDISYLAFDIYLIFELFILSEAKDVDFKPKSRLFTSFRVNI
jgi:hypothetical protein